MPPGWAKPKVSHQAWNALVDIPMTFDKTPTNIALHVFDALGVGYAKALGHGLRRVVGGGMTEGQQRAFATAFADASLGTCFIGLGILLHRNGLLSGLTDDDQAKSDRDKTAGRTPGSLLIDGEWNQVMGFTPPGLLMTVGATLDREDQQEHRNPFTKIASMFKFGLQSLLEVPALKGMSDISDAIKAPTGRGASYVGSQISTLAPAFGADIAGLLDSSQRDTRNSLLAPLINRIPGWRNTLPAQFDALGRPVMNTAPRQLLPTQPTPARELTDPVDRELRRLDVGLSYPEKQIVDGKVEPDDAYRERARAIGQVEAESVTRIVKNPAYQALENRPGGREAQQNVLKGALSAAKVPTEAPRFLNDEDSRLFDHNITVEAAKQAVLSKLHSVPAWNNKTTSERKTLENRVSSKWGNFKFDYSGVETEKEASERLDDTIEAAKSILDPKVQDAFVKDLYDPESAKATRAPRPPRPLEAP